MTAIIIATVETTIRIMTWGWVFLEVGWFDGIDDGWAVGRVNVFAFIEPRRTVVYPRSTRMALRGAWDATKAEERADMLVFVAVTVYVILKPMTTTRVRLSVTMLSSSTMSLITMALEGTPRIDARLAVYNLWNASDTTSWYVIPETNCSSDRHTWVHLL